MRVGIMYLICKIILRPLIELFDLVEIVNVRGYHN